MNAPSINELVDLRSGSGNDNTDADKNGPPLREAVEPLSGIKPEPFIAHKPAQGALTPGHDPVSAWWVPTFDGAKPLPAGWVWCAWCGAAKLAHEHLEPDGEP